MSLPESTESHPPEATEEVISSSSSRPNSLDQSHEDRLVFASTSSSSAPPPPPSSSHPTTTTHEEEPTSNGYSNGNGYPTTEAVTRQTEEQSPSVPVPAAREEQQEQEQEREDGRGMSLKELRLEFERTRKERNEFEGNYNVLMGKLTAMRSSVASRIQGDAEELDKREAEINDLTAANDDLQQTIETLKSELISSNEDSELAHSELEQLRLRAFDSQKQSSEEVVERERALRDAQEDLERARIEREEWESEAMRERVKREEGDKRIAGLEMELGVVKSEREELREERDREAEAAGNLHAVLEEFQAAKDKELKATLGDLQLHLQAANKSLAEYKQRAAQAEGKLAAAQNDSEKVLALTKDVKDKSLLIGKLRHEAVILNEHLTEALRRLKKDSAENSVDRRLISNVLISFLNTPRGDTKRFEMLQLISSILSWSDDQREQVGLQRSSAISGSSLIASGSRGRGANGHSRSGRATTGETGLGENEGFGQLWVEFLLKEASTASSTPPPPSTSASSSTGPLSPTASAPGSPPPTSPTRFEAQLPPLMSPPLMSPTGTRRPSFSALSNTSGGSAEALKNVLKGGSGTSTPSSNRG